MCANDQRYNLLDEKWLPVLTLHGDNERLGIIETLDKAAAIRQIAPSNPMDRFAVFRFLLAVCYWCADRTGKPFPANGNGIPMEWITFLRGQHDCFNLLGDGKRFYQDIELAPNLQKIKPQKKKPVTNLFHELPSGHNSWHFRHVIDSENGVCPSCAAMALLRPPVFSMSGFTKLSHGINGVPPVYWFFDSGTLLHTIRLNWNPGDNPGLPSWTTEQPFLQPSNPVSLLQGLTSIPVQVFLNETESGGEPCSVCGENHFLFIRTIYMQEAGWSKGLEWQDPHVLWATKVIPKKKETKYETKILRVSDPIKTPKISIDKTLLTILKHRDWIPFSRGNKIHFVVFSIDSQNSKGVDTWEQMVTIPAMSLDEARRDLWGNAITYLSERIHDVLWKYNDKDYEKKRKDKEEQKNAKKKAPTRTAFISRLSRPHVEEQVANHMTDLLSGNGDYTWDDAANEYAPFMKAAAESLAPDVTIRDAKKRREIKRLRPRLPKEDK